MMLLKNATSPWRSDTFSSSVPTSLLPRSAKSSVGQAHHYQRRYRDNLILFNPLGSSETGSSHGDLRFNQASSCFRVIPRPPMREISK